MGENTLYLDFPGNEVKPIFGWDQVCAANDPLLNHVSNMKKKDYQKVAKNHSNTQSMN